MQFLLTFTLIIFLIYFLIMLFSFIGWKITAVYKPGNMTSTGFDVSVVIPFRNDFKNLKRLLDDLHAQDYPANHYEVIAVNDHSEDIPDDSSLDSVSNILRIKFIDLPGNLSGKKAALDYGIRHSTGQLILITDADCRVSEKWISTFAGFYSLNNQPCMIIGLAIHENAETLITRIQALEFLSLVATGAGAAGIGHPIYCNGANLLFDKNFYLESYDPTRKDIVSGDDTFILHQLKKSKGCKITLLKSHEAVVTTKGSEKFSEFLNQRIRWASKSRHYKDRDILIAAFTVFLCNLALVFWAFTLIFKGYALYILLLAAKTGIDMCFLYPFLVFFNKHRFLYLMPFAELIYPLYIIITGIAGNFIRYRWKGRKY